MQASPDEAAGGSLCHNSAQRGRQLSLTFHQTAPRQPPPLLTQSRIALRWLRILASLLLYEEKEHAGRAQQTRTRLLKCSKSSSLPMRSLPPSSILMATAQPSRTKRAALWQAQARRQGTDRRQTSAWQSSLLAARPHLGPKLPKPSCPPWNHTLSLKEEVVCCAVQQVDCGRPALAASQAFSTLCVRASAMLNGSRPLQAQAPRCALCGRPLATLGPVRPQKAEAERWVAVSAKRRGGDSAGRSRRPLLVSVDPYGSDLWRLDPVIQLLRDGAV